MFAGPAGVDRRLAIGFGSLTLGPNLTVRGQRRGTIGGSASGAHGGSGINQGHISADASDQTISVIGSLTNSGTVEAINGGSLSIPYTPVEPGRRTVDEPGVRSRWGAAASSMC